jgi:hypothetical protein
LATAIAAAHPTLPGVVEARFEVTVPITSLPTVVLQAIKVAGAASGTTNTLTVTLDPDPVPSCNPNGSLGGGSGTVSNPYLVCAPEHLRVLDFNQTVHARQVADIDMAESTQRGLDMQPGSSFDGGGFLISNYTAELPLISRVQSGGIVRNVTLRNARVAASARNQNALLIGMAEDAILEDIDVEGLLTTGRSASDNGAIVGFAQDCKMARMRSHAEVVGDSNAALAIGQMRGGSATEVHVTGRVHSFGTTGGLVGLLRDGGQVHFSSVDAYLNSNANVGGIAGSITAGANEITHSRFQGQISASGNSGGIAASLSGGGRVASCVASGEIMATVGNSAGGLLGSMSGTGDELVDSLSTVTVRAGYRFDLGDGNCRVAGAVGSMNGGQVTRVVVAPPSVQSPNPVPDLIGGQCSGTVDLTTDAYLVEATPGGELDTFVDVSGAPGVEASYPALDFVKAWAIPSVNPLHPAGLTLPVPRGQCGRGGVVCP